MAASILVVEDNQLNRDLVRAVLECRGHEVREADSVETAREALAARLPAVVLLDVQIPGGGGERLLREVRARPDWARLPVIAVTALAMPTDEARLLALGFDGYVPKPIDTRAFGPYVESFFTPRTGDGDDRTER